MPLHWLSFVSVCFVTLFIRIFHLTTRLSEIVICVLVDVLPLFLCRCVCLTCFLSSFDLYVPRVLSVGVL